MSEKRCLGCMLPKQGSPICEHCGHDERQPNAPHQLPPGTVLHDQYIVGRVLGQGGFGITYIGWDQFLDIPVAIKEFYPSGVVMRDCGRSQSVFLTSQNMNQSFITNRDRFVREATSLAKLGRSSGAANIVRVQNLVQANSTAYIIMEYVDGIDMRRYMRRNGGTLTLEETMRLLLPLMDSLEQVHQNHIVHRDISPDNIMVLPDGSTKLIDFGAAHEFRQDDQKSTEAILKHGFAPPEQYQRKGEMGPWTDVYALCATIYYCTTGELPPTATDRVLGAEDFQWDRIPGISAGMIRVLTNATAINKNDRTQSMAQLRQALTAGLTEEPPIHAETRNDPPLSTQEQVTVPLGTGSSTPYSAADPLAYTAPVQRSQAPVYTVPVAEPNAPTYTAPVSEQSAPSHTAPVVNQQIPFSTVPVSSGNTPAYTVPVPDPEKPQHTPPAPKSQRSGKSPSCTPVQKKRRYPLIAAAVIIVVLCTLVFINTGNKSEPDKEPKTSATGFQAWKDNVLMHTYDGLHRETFEEYAGLPVFRSNIRNDQVRSVTFLASLDQEGPDSWDVSQNQDGSVIAWAEPHGDLYDLYIAAENGINGSIACNRLFTCFENLISVTFGDAFHTDTATSLHGAFFGCGKLIGLNLSSFNTTCVTDMSYMFSGCRKLTQLNISGLDTIYVKDLSNMFSHCTSLTKVDVSKFSTTYVTNMQSMFWDCPNLTSLDVSGFDTARVTNMDSMFSGCRKLTQLDVSGFDTSNVTNTRCMFENCAELTELDVSNFDTGNVTNMEFMFYGTEKLKAITISDFNTASVTLSETSGGASNFMDLPDTVNGQPWMHWFYYGQYNP